MHGYCLQTLSVPRSEQFSDNVLRQIFLHMFEAKWRLLCLLSGSAILQIGRILGDLFSKLLNVKVILSVLKILLDCSKTFI